MTPKRPAVAGKRAVVSKMAAGKKRGSPGSNDEKTLQSIVIPPTDAVHDELNLSPEMNRQLRLVDTAWQRYSEQKFLRKRDEIERMHRKMAEACLELEKSDPFLFKCAMVRTLGDYMPIERRLPVDTPPLRGWNHENALDTKVNDSDAEAKGQSGISK